MIDRTKTSKRLGIVGAAAAVGLVPLSVLATPAFAASNASLQLADTTPNAATTATNSFTVTNTAGASTLTIQSQVANPGTTTSAETLPAQCTGTNTPAGCGTYTVTYTTSTTTTPTSDTATVTTTPTTPAAGDTASLALATPIPNGAVVTVKITNVTNGKNGSVVFFTDNDGAGATNTNTVSIAYTPVAAPGVTSVNPTAFNATTGGEPFTIVGTNFSSEYNGYSGIGTTTGGYPSPVVCFVPSASTPPAPTPATTTNGPCGTGNFAVTPAPAGTTTYTAGQLTSVAPLEIQGLSPSGLTPGSYNVVVYNYDASANSGAGGYTAASGTTSQTLVSASNNLDFVPESGVRVVDSRSGLNVPRGTLATGSPITIPMSSLAQSPSLPTNLAANAKGLAVNVTAIAPASGGNIQMWTSNSCTNGIVSGQAVQPATVNFQPPQDTNNSQVIPINGSNLCVQDNGAAVNLTVDVTGYTTDYTPVNKRVLDTRPATQVGSLQGPLQSNTVYRVQVCGTGAVIATCPTGPVAFNVAAVAPSAPGNLRVFPEPATGAPAPSAVPNTAVDNYIVNTDASAMIVTNVTPNATTGNGYIDLYSAMSGSGTIQAVIDELGTLPTYSSVHTVTEPYRIYDSRPGPIAAAGTVTVSGAPTGSGTNFTPAGAVGLVGNLSDINPTGQGYLVTFPAGGTVPGTASIADFPMQTRNTNNIVALNPTNGSFSIYAGGAATNTTYDTSGYISSGIAANTAPAGI